MTRKNPGRHHREGTLFVVSAPSGAGKTTLCRKLLKKNAHLKLSVSYTTREPRRGEVNDVDYTFITKKRFMTMIDRGEFAEWAMVHGNLYGTSLKRIQRMSGDGYDILLDIDIRGAMQIKKTYKSATFIFILPPSLKELRERLLKRKTDSMDVIRKRLDNAKEEIAYYKDYDFVIVNDELDTAFQELKSIITASGLKSGKIEAPWIKKQFKLP